MSRHATSPFTVDKFEPSVVDEVEGTALGRVHIEKTFTGDVQGKGVVEMLSAATPAGPAAYVAVERVSATVHGKTGTFAFLHVGSMRDGAGTLSLTIVPGTGTGELKGITGNAQIIMEDRKHLLELDYDLA